MNMNVTENLLLVIGNSTELPAVSSERNLGSTGSTNLLGDIDINADEEAHRKRTDDKLAFNQHLTYISLGILVLLFFICALFCYFHYKTKKELRNLEEGLAFIEGKKDQVVISYKSQKVLDKVKEVAPLDLEDKYCIISFNSVNQEKHRNYIKPCVTGRERTQFFEEATCLVEKSGDVLKIPRHKVMLIFIDKNEKHAFLDTLDSSRKDLKSLTVNVCLKMKAEVFVIYVGDEGSDNLTPGLYCNPQITEITEHPILKELEAKERVITCFNSLTFSQQGKIAEFIA